MGRWRSARSAHARPQHRTRRAPGRQCHAHPGRLGGDEGVLAARLVALHGGGDAIEPSLLLLGERVLRQRHHERRLATALAGAGAVVVARPLARGGGRGHVGVGRVLRNGRLDAVDRQPVRRERRFHRHARQRVGQQVGQVELRVLEVEDAGSDGATEARRVGRSEAVEGLARAQAQRIVDVLGGERVAPPRLLELDRLLDQVAQAVLDIGRQRVGDLVLELADADGLGDDADRRARDDRYGLLRRRCGHGRAGSNAKADARGRATMVWRSWAESGWGKTVRTAGYFRCTPASSYSTIPLFFTTRMLVHTHVESPRRGCPCPCSRGAAPSPVVALRARPLQRARLER